MKGEKETMANNGHILDEKPFSVYHAGKLFDLGQRITPQSKAFGIDEGKLFLKKRLGLTSMEVSINKLPPGGTSKRHRHRENEELYLFIAGTGEMEIDGEIVGVTEGNAINVRPQAFRVWKDTRNGRPLLRHCAGQI
jgi:mannose-6-phosphate isomerase-like protein (cupin superfamily)